MKVGRTIKNYDLTLTDKDINILIECIQNCKLDNFRHQNHAEDLAEQFVNIFLDENHEKYVRNYLEEVELHLKDYGIEDDMIEIMIRKTKEYIENDPKYVFHHNAKTWAKMVAEINGIDTEEVYGENGFFGIVTGKYADKIREELLKPVSQSAIQRNKDAQELLKKLRS